MSMMDNELYDTFGEEYKTLATRVEQLEKVTDGDLIVMPDGTTFTMQDLGLTDVSVRVFYQSDAPTGLNSSTHVGDVWIDSDNGTAWFWDGISWVSKGVNDNYSGGMGLEALGPGVVSRLLTSIDITSAGSAPGSPTWGDVWRDTSSGNAVKRWNGSAWITIIDQNIINAIDVALTAPGVDVSDGGIRVFYMTVAPGGLNATTHKGDLWYDVDDSWKSYRWNGTAWAATEGTGEEEGATDGLPPGFSPTPNVGSGIGSLFITWDAVPNADPIWYMVYIDDAPGVALTGANYAGQFWGEVAVIQRMPDDSALIPNTTYYAKVVAMDADGAAAPGGEASGQITLIDLDQFAADVRADVESIDTIRTTADGKNTNYYQAAMPTGGTYALNDEWFDTDAGYKPYRWNGSTWTAYQIDGFQVLADGSITANQIQSQAITTSKISAGAITADKLAANVITADAIVIGTNMGSNSIQNPSFESQGQTANKPAGWQMISGDSTRWDRFALADSPDGAYVLRVLPTQDGTGNTHYIIRSKAIPFTAGARYTVSAFVRADAVDNTWVWRVRVWYSNSVDADGYAIGGVYTEFASNNYNTAWTNSSTQFTPGSGYKYVSVVIDHQSPNSTLYVDNIRLVTATDSVMIADGAIVASKIGANEIIAEKIAVGAITSDKLAANSVTAGKLAAGAITSSSIASGTINAAHIQSNTIQSYHLSSSSVTAGKVAAGAIDAMTITGAYIQTHSWNYGVKISSSGLFAFNSSGNYSMYFSAGSSNVYLYGGRIEGGLFRSSTFGQYIEIGDTGWGDSVDELRMFNNGTVNSIRHLSGWTGYIYCNLWNGAISLNPTSDGWVSVQRGTSGPRLKFVSTSLQAYNGSNTGYIMMQASSFQPSSRAAFKRGIAKPHVKPSEVLPSTGLRKWHWTDEFLGITAVAERAPETFADDDPTVTTETPAIVKKEKGQKIKDQMLAELQAQKDRDEYGLIADELPDWLQSGDGYSIPAVLGFLWEALKEANERIETLEKKEP